MDEIGLLCRQVLGRGQSAQQAAAQARVWAEGDRIALLRAAVRTCRAQAEQEGDGRSPAPGQPEEPRTLAQAVARELETATAKLPERQREVLALRELMRLSHGQIAQVMELEPEAVPTLLVRARLRLRAERRASHLDLPECDQAERSRRLLARRQDSEPLPSQDHEWVLAHVAQCRACEMVQAAMLEASVCYRAALPT